MVTAAPGLRIATPSIVLDGEDNADLAERLVSLSVVETAAGLYRCEALFTNWGAASGDIGYLFFDRKTFDFGKPFAVRIDRDTIFEGRVMGIEAEFPDGRVPKLNVLAEDGFQDLRMTRRTRSFDEKSDAEVIRQIAQDHGFQADIELPGARHRVLAQVNQSDLAFIRERARFADGRIWMAGKTLFARRNADSGAPAITLTYGAGLRELSLLADLAEQRTSVTVSGWDVAAKSRISYEASSPAIQSELNGLDGGGATLARAFGDRKEMVVNSVPFTPQEAQSSAEALFRKQARRFVRGRGTAEPYADLSVGRRVDLRGIGPMFEGAYELTEVRHLFDGSRGLRTEFTAERPGIGSGR